MSLEVNDFRAVPCPRAMPTKVPARDRGRLALPSPLGKVLGLSVIV
jgi:hypothetical protein